MENREEKTKLAFGLSPVAVIVNTIVLTLIAEFSWAVIAVKCFLETQKIDVPWYCYVPFECISIYMFIKWLYYKFKINPEDSKNDNRRRITFGLGFILMVLTQMFLKFLFAMIIFSYLK